MLFGLTNAPPTFQSPIKDLLCPYLRPIILVFFDDILIYNSNFSDHLVHLEIVFNLLESNIFVAKLTKLIT